MEAGSEILVKVTGEWEDYGAVVLWTEGPWVIYRDYYGVARSEIQHVKLKIPRN
jgi:hypothetical protein